MNLQNGYKVIYEKIADGKRAFYATKNRNCDPTVDDKIAEVVIGEYKLIYEKDGKFYGSVTGIPSDDDFCYEAFDKIFKKAVAEETPNKAHELLPEEPKTEPEGPTGSSEQFEEEPEDAEF